jgi:uncharacterized membrane protein (DUF485 family)
LESAAKEFLAMKKHLIEVVGAFLREVDLRDGDLLLGEADRAGTAKRKASVTDALRDAIRLQRWLVAVPLAMVVALFGVAFVVLIRFGSQPDLIAKTLGAMGVSSGGLLTWAVFIMRDLWRKELIVAAAGRLDDAAFAELLRLEIRAPLDPVPAMGSAAPTSGHGSRLERAPTTRNRHRQ